MVFGGKQPTFASHNNPWATPDDTVQAKNHDVNQEQSIDTPGEDEMLGDMIQNATRGPSNSSKGGGETGGGHGGGG
ncbi:hypothetical protein [Pseudogemmobacter sp. W21_MBD1_M6]|uniref:hypothetical protein n=1 Tax=Pseudogemmobacter sp. W21_MBD1_M6 TaxID=3240271 RepID=UPI003F9A2619